MAKYKSIITWPEGCPSLQSSRPHETEIEAADVILEAKTKGWCGEGEFFPVESKIEPVGADDEHIDAMVKAMTGAATRAIKGLGIGCMLLPVGLAIAALFVVGVFACRHFFG